MLLNPYQSLVSLLSNILEAYTTAFFIVDPKSRQLNMVASQTLSKFLPDKVVLSLEQSGILGQVQKVGQTIHLEKLHEATSSLSSTIPFYREGESHIKGLFAIPVGNGAGVLYVDTKYSWGFNDKQRKWIGEIAEVLNELLQRNECSRQQESYARIFEVWQRLDRAAFKGSAVEDYFQLIINECSQLVGSEYGFLAIREAGRKHYRLMAATANVPRGLTSQHYLVKQGLIGWIFQNNKTLLISRLNPETPEHFLFSPGESLPHHGTLWGVPTRTSLGHAIVMAFLSRQSMEWSTEYENAVSHSLHFFQLLLEQFYYKEECEHLQAYDLNTGLLNVMAFESRLEGMITASMHNSTPFTLAVVQFEPWQILSTKAPPKQLRQWQREIAQGMSDILPPSVAMGQIAENRFGLLFPELAIQEANHHLNRLREYSQQVITGKLRAGKLVPYVASVGFPQDGTRSEELWPLLNRRLFSVFRPKSENAGT